MFLMYVDESGDCGLQGSPSRFFALTGVVLHELRWKSSLEQLLNFRRRMKNAFGLKLREEIHASAFITRPGDLVRIRRNERLTILRFFIDELAAMNDVSIINVLVDKSTKNASYDVFENAWRALIQRFENTLRYRNLPGPMNSDERGMIMPDDTDNKKLRRLLRRMRRYNPIPNQAWRGVGFRDMPVEIVIEDPNFRQSQDSYFIQAADVAAYALYQRHDPNVYIRKKGAVKYFERLEPVLCKKASSDPLGIVRL